MSEKEKENEGLEKIMDKIEDTIRRLEEEPLSLEESFETFSEGMRLVKAGSETIDGIEKKLEVLTRETAPEEKDDE